MIDIGANLTHSSFKEDLGEVVARARAAGVATLIVTGTTVEESREAAQIAERFDLHSTVGIHPHHAKDFKGTDELKSIAAHPRVVAIGECGLDFNRNYSPHPAQEECFAAQLQLGIELKKPLFLHSRDAHPRFAQIVKSMKVERAVAHCFTGEREELRAYLDLGLYIGITGWICDERRGRHLVDVVGRIPADRLMIETDAPYILPRTMPHPPKDRRNEPAFLPHVLGAVAAARREDPAVTARATTATARAFFAIPTGASGNEATGTR